MGDDNTRFIVLVIACFSFMIGAQIWILEQERDEATRKYERESGCVYMATDRKNRNMKTFRCPDGTDITKEIKR